MDNLHEFGWYTGNLDWLRDRTIFLTRTGSHAYGMATKDRVETVDPELVEQAVREMGLAPNLIPVLVAERKYRAAMRNWTQHETWRAERNPKRAALEAKYGYDTKHGAHLVRLLRMGVEILNGQGVVVKRPDAAELLDIRRGAWTYDTLEAWAQGQEATLETAYQTSNLPREPNREAWDRVVVQITAQILEAWP